MKLSRIAFLILITITLCAQANAACVTDQRATSGAETGTGASGVSVSFTANYASPLLVAVHTQIRTVSSVTWNGTSMTQLGTTVSAGAGAFRESLYGIANPATGTHNVTVTLSANDDFNFDMISTQGCDTATGFRTAYTANDGGGAGPAITVANSQSGDLVFNAAIVDATTITFNGGE